MKPRYPLIAAALLAGAHFTMRGLGLGAHTSIIAGMPQSDASWILGPIYALSWLAFVTLTPILGAVAVMELLLRRRSAHLADDFALRVRDLGRHDSDDELRPRSERKKAPLRLQP